MTAAASTPPGATRRRPIRVLLAKVGLDGHDRGVKTVARYLMDAGMEVVFTGLRATPEQVARTALEEGVDAVGLSFLAGDHMILVPRVMDRLRQLGVGEILVVVGGIILKRDIPALERSGVARVFLPGTPPEQIAQYIDSTLKQKGTGK